MSQAKVQAPYMPGLKEAADLVDEQQQSSNSKSSGFVSLGGNPGEGGGQKQKQQGDYYTPVATEVVEKGGSKPSEELDGNREGAEMNDLYSPDAAVGITTSEKQPENNNSRLGHGRGGAEAAGTDEREQRAGTAAGSPVSVRGAHVMEKLTALPLPSEPLEAVRRTLGTGLKGAFITTRDAVQRTKQSLLLRVFPPSSATQAHKVVEEMEKDVLGNSEGSGEDMSQATEGPKVSETSAPQFMRARL